MAQVRNEIEMSSGESLLLSILESLVKEDLLDPYQAEVVWENRKLVGSE
jgi:hypothetical protein